MKPPHTLWKHPTSYKLDLDIHPLDIHAKSEVHTSVRLAGIAVLKTREILPVVLRATYPEKQVALTKSK